MPPTAGSADDLQDPGLPLAVPVRMCQPVVVGGPPCPCPPGPVLAGGPGSAGGPLEGGETLVGGAERLGGDAWLLPWAPALLPGVTSLQ
jgi:hypothetical protein